MNESLTQRSFDRATQDIGNIVELQHLHMSIGDQRNATAFYVLGLGLTRDPYLRVGFDIMGINVGRSEIHMPTSGRELSGNMKPAPIQVLRGTIGLVLPDLSQLMRRLEKVATSLRGTKFGFGRADGAVEVTCPWGNRFRCHAPSSQFGDTDLALAYVEFDVPRGAAEGIARFYRDGMLAIADVERRGREVVTTVTAGIAQKLLFRETDAPLPPYDGHHLQIYVVNFSAPHRYLSDRNLIIEESDASQYRFENIIDPADGRVLFTVEHEVRSLRHPCYNRPLINRNTAQTIRNSERGHDDFRGSY